METQTTNNQNAQNAQKVEKVSVLRDAQKEMAGRLAKAGLEELRAVATAQAETLLETRLTLESESERVNGHDCQLTKLEAKASQLEVKAGQLEGRMGALEGPVKQALEACAGALKSQPTFDPAVITAAVETLDGEVGGLETVVHGPKADDGKRGGGIVKRVEALEAAPDLQAQLATADPTLSAALKKADRAGDIAPIRWVRGAAANRWVQWGVVGGLAVGIGYGIYGIITGDSDAVTEAAETIGEAVG